MNCNGVIRASAPRDHSHFLQTGKGLLPIACWIIAALAFSDSLQPLHANAGMVTVQTPGLLASDPLFVEDMGNVSDPFGPNWKASANLPTGKLKAFSDLNSTNNNIGGFPNARASLTDSASYSGPTATFPAGYFNLGVDASYLQSSGGPQTGIRTIGSRLEANIFLNINGVTQAFATAQHAFVFEQDFAGNLRLISDTYTPTTSGGATITVNSISPSGIDLKMNLPQFTLNDGDTFGYSAALSVTALASGSLNQSTTDAFQTAQLSFTLPPGVSLNNFNFGGSSPFTPSWAHAVPEPSNFVLLVMAGLAAACSTCRLKKRTLKRVALDEDSLRVNWSFPFFFGGSLPLSERLPRWGWPP